MPDPASPSRQWFHADAATLARRLLGQKLLRLDPETGEPVGGLIVETEAYLGERDKAAHTYGGRRTQRNESMWGEAGLVYVYFTYGMHHCLNVVARRAGVPEAVLIRALEPTDGVGRMWPRRRAAKRMADLCSGPAKLCEALAIDRSLDGVDLLGGGPLRLGRRRQRALPGSRIATGPRVGVGYAEEWAAEPLRFRVSGNAYCSRP